jgi:hypothetical protein
VPFPSAPGATPTSRDNGAYQNGNFTGQVAADPNQVEHVLGINFAPAGKRQTIIYDHGLNYCRGGNAGYTELRDMHQSGDRVRFGNELNVAMTNAGLSIQALATQLLNTQLPHWNNNPGIVAGERGAPAGGGTGARAHPCVLVRAWDTVGCRGQLGGGQRRAALRADGRRDGPLRRPRSQ